MAIGGAVSVEDRLESFAVQGLDRARGLGEDHQQLWLSLRATARSGKRLRSALLMAAYRSFGGADDEMATRAGAAIELLHAAFVIHDDVIDHDLRRRGCANVSGVFVDRAARRGVDVDGCETSGLAAGVLAGDLALVGAVGELVTCGADAAVTRDLLDRLTEAVAVSAAGELDDVAMSIDPEAARSLGEVLTVAERKTAVYSFQLPLQLGAVLAGAPTACVEQLGTVGRLAGIGFQLVDDLRGVFADETTTGKSALGDLREGKLTALIVHARSTEAWAELSQYIGDPRLDADGAARARRLLTECGSRGVVQQLAHGYLDAALQAAAESAADPAGDPASGADGGAAAPLLAELTELCERIWQSAA